MRSNYKRLGNYIKLVEGRNAVLQTLPLMGLSITKKFIPSIANLVGTDMTTYRTIIRNQFAYSPVTSRNGDKITIALFDDHDKALISQAYTPFEVIDKKELLPEYLMMWFRRTEFDRYARFMSHGSARELFSWEDLCDLQMPIPSLTKQKEILKEYNVIQNRIALNKQLIQKLEETAQAIYKQWFVDFEFPGENGKPYKINGGEVVFNEELEKEIPKGWKVIKLKDLVGKENPITYSVVKPGEEDENGVKFIRSGDVKNGEILFSQLRTISTKMSSQYKRTMLSGGEILISIVGNPGQVAIVPFFLKDSNIARQVALIKVVDNNVQLFLKNYLISKEGKESLKNITIGSVQEVINLEDLRTLKSFIPAKKVLVKFDKIAKALEKELQLNFLLNEKLLSLNAILLSKLVTI